MKNIALGTHFQGLNRQFSFKGLLDIYQGAAAAYSLRKLSKATTSVVRVRRDSDNAEADFTALEITDGTLEAFCTGTDGLVTTWYDQSGNGNDATQSTASAQPKIVDAGVLVEENGKVALDFDGSDDYLINANGILNNATDVYSSIVFSKSLQATSVEFIFSCPSGDILNRGFDIRIPNATDIQLAIRTNPSNTGSNAIGNFNYSSGNANLVTGTFNASLSSNEQKIYGNGSLVAQESNSGTSIVNNGANGGILIGKFGEPNLFGDLIDGTLQELIIYPSDQSSNRNGIEANINKAFNIYWDGTQKGLLDTYTGAEAAYSLRALNSAYTGAIIKVRRASDNAEQDIYAKWDGTLNVEALETFCAATDGYVVTWYDQSGNANNATQATAASQPQIVSSGSIITDSGYQVIQYDGTDDNLGTSFTATGTMLMGGADGGAFYEVAVSGAYSFLPSASLTDHPLNESIRVIWGSSLTTAQKTAIEAAVTYTDWDFSDVTSFSQYWRLRNELTSFPLIDTSSGTSFNSAWRSCSSLTSFPLLDLSIGTDFVNAWYGCSSLTSFPALDVSSGNSFSQAWYTCFSLTSFPLLDVSSGTNFSYAWYFCSSLQDFPANMFDSVTATNFTGAFSITNLTQTSIDNILTSIDTANTSNGTFDQSGGSAPSALGEAAIDSLIAKGWTITVTGIYDTLGAFLYRVETDGGIVEDEANLRQELTDLNI